MVDKKVENLLQLIRNKCLYRNVSGIKCLSVLFRRMDTNFDKRLSFEELDDGLKEFGIDIVNDDLRILFTYFDKDKNNEIDFLELVAKLRPPMTTRRIGVVNEAFDSLDANKDGILNIDDLKSKFND